MILHMYSVQNSKGHTFMIQAPIDKLITINYSTEQ